MLERLESSYRLLDVSCNTIETCIKAHEMEGGRAALVLVYQSTCLIIEASKPCLCKSRIIICKPAKINVKLDKRRYLLR